MSKLTFKYVRIQGKELAKNTMYAKGVFSMCWQLIQNDVMEGEEMNAYLTEHPANYHITGSYEKLAKYTGYVDFSDGKPVDRTITGTFGAYLNGAKIAFDGAEVDKKL